MSIATSTLPSFQPWTEEPSNRPDRKKIRARIGGLHCSLCTGTIEKALGRMPGVDKVAVSLTHEQALVEYDPAVARPDELLQTLRDVGYTISDPRKLRAFEEEERDLVSEARRFVAAVALSVAAIPIIADSSVGWIGFLPALVCLSPSGFVCEAGADRRRRSAGRTGDRRDRLSPLSPFADSRMFYDILKGMSGARRFGPVGDSSTVESRTLTPLIMARIQVPQPCTSLI
jgi:copper chaperone CopZ